MSNSQGQPVVQNNENETVTLIALPLHLFQATQNNQLVVEHNLLIKTLPDGSLVLDTNQLSDGTETIPITASVENSTPNEKKKETDSPSKGNNKIRTSPNNISKSNSSNEKNGKVKIRYINSKTTPDLVVRPGRPRKIKPLEKGPYKCTHCEKEFEKWVLYKRHENSHNNDKKYKCSNCDASYHILSNYILHVATHNTNKPTCPECGKNFQRVASLKAHLIHHEKEETFYCQDCDITFSNDVDLNNHIKEHCVEKKSIANLQCKYCNYKFTVPAEYKKHMSEHNKMRNILRVHAKKKTKRKISHDRKHQCSHCKKSFDKLSQLDRHLRVHSGEKPFVCVICEKAFNQKGSLQLHMTKHNGLRPYKCTLCPAKFSQKGNLRAHILKTHSIPRPGENVYSCTECSCVFKKLGSLNGHMTRNHPETNEDIKSVISQLVAMQGNMNVTEKDILQQAILQSDLNNDVANDEKGVSTTFSTYADSTDGVKKYVIKQRISGSDRWHQCNYCCKEFRKPSDLVRHIRVHTREKPYKCRLCIKSFAVKSTLTAHLKTHTNLKELKCSHCPKLFSSLSNLNVHLQVHAKNKPHMCLVCNKSFKTTVLLKHHLRQHMSPEEISKILNVPDEEMQEPIIITNRGLQTVDVPLKKRPLTEAGAKHRPYSCTVCGAGFRKMSQLKYHHISHTGQRSYKCNICLKLFPLNSGLKAHILTHNGAKPYRCQICSKHFTTNGSLRRHLDSHSTTRPVICPYCFKNFKTVVTCRKHIKTHQGETADESKESDFPQKINELPYQPDLEDALADDTFTLTPMDAESIIITEDNVQSQNLQTLQADETGTVVLPIIPSQENLTQENIREIEDTLNTQMLNIIGNENFIDASVYSNKDPISSTDELVNTLTGNDENNKIIDDNQLLYQTVFVNVAEPLPTFDSNFDINQLVLSQLKLQNESLFLTDLSSININDSNVLLPFQLTTQIDSQNGEMMMIPSDLNQNLPINIQNEIDPLETNIQNVFMPVTDTNMILDTEQIQASPDIQTILNPDSNIEENLNNITIVTNNSIVQEPGEIPLFTSVNEVTTITPQICNICKVQFTTERQLKTHQCINLVQVENMLQNQEAEKEAENMNENSLLINNVKTTIEKESSVVDKNVSNNLQETEKQSEPKGSVHKNQCTYCTKSFKKRSDLERHLRTHTGERPYKCDECAKCFSLKSTLEGHQKIHQGKKEFLCVVCNSMFATKGSLKVHMRLHTGSKPYKCDFCNMKFRTPGHRKSHLDVHYKEALKTGKVPEEIITRKAKILTIVDASIQESVKTANTEILTNEINLQNVQESFEQFSNSETLIIESDNTVIPFSITQGEDIININPNVLTDENGQQKITVLDSKSKEQFEQIFSKNIVQIQSIRTTKKEKHPCSVCNKEFSSKYFLERHMKIHTREKNFCCDICTKKFNQKSALKEHKRTHIGQRPYNCPYCSNTFSQRGNLKTHIKRIHAAMLAPVESLENGGLNPVFLNII